MLRSKAFLLKIFLAVVAAESMLALYSLVSIPSDVKNTLIFGFSPSRLALAGGVSMVFFAAVFLLGWFYTSNLGMGRTVQFVNEFLLDTKKSRILVLTCGLTSLTGVLFLLTPAGRIGNAIYLRIIPVVLLGAAITLQMLVGQFLWLEEKIYWKRLAEWKRPLAIAGVIILLLMAFSTVISWSGIGIRPERSGWFSPGTPVLTQQVLFAWAIGLLFILFGRQLDRYKKSNKLNFIIGAALWLTAGLAWWMEPLRRLSYFTTAPTPPNFESYPYSDSALYDQFAQHILIGTSRQFGLTLRPLYSIFLALLHALGGQKFEVVIALQVFLLAVMPVLVYLLASKLGGRPAGILAALIAIFRERNSIALTNVIEVSHSKLLMSDVPTMTMMLVFLYFFVKWLQDEQNRYYLGALAGAFFGLTILIRSQAQLLIPIALLSIVIAKKDGWKPILQKSLIFLLGALVVVAPWVWRNYQISGRVVVEYQAYYTRWIASSYSSSLRDTEMLPNETTEQYDARMKKMIINFILNNPQEVARAYSSYFIHNEISSLIYLPMDYQFQDINTYVNEMGFWKMPVKGLSAGIFPIFLFVLVMIAVGLGTAIYRAKWVGIVPLLFHFGYSFSVVPIHASGWRFILPVDWVSLLYFSIGLMQISIILLALFFEKGDYHLLPMLEQNSLQPAVWKKTMPVLAIFMVIGLSLPLIEWGIPVRYPAMDVNKLIQTYVPNGFILADEQTVTATDLKTFLETEAGAVVLYGRALYPRYYKKGEFWGDDDSYPLRMRNMDRLQFNLIGAQRGGLVFIPMTKAPEYFPHASDVLIVGCNTKDGIQALAVKVNDGPAFVTTSPWHGLTCSTQ